MGRKKVEAASSRFKTTRQDAASTCYPELLRSYGISEVICRELFAKIGPIFIAGTGYLRFTARWESGIKESSIYKAFRRIVPGRVPGLLNPAVGVVSLASFLIRELWKKQIFQKAALT